MSPELEWSHASPALDVAPRPEVRRKSALREYGEALAVALVLALILRSFVVQAFKIPSGSMLPTLQVGDHVLVSKLRYGLRVPFLGGWLLRYADPVPGDVVVFTYPLDRSKDFIKRVVAVAGDEVEIRDKQLLIDGAPREMLHAYFAEGRDGVGSDGPRDQYGPIRVPEGNVFVMGDNRDRSYDSRYWGFVDLDDVQGKAVVLYWSWDGRGRWVRWERLGTMID